MKTVLYLDETNTEIEKLLISFKPSNLNIKFLSPSYGEKGVIEEADYIITTNVPITRELIEAALKLKLIARAGVGYDNVDIMFAKEKGIPVTVAEGANASSVSELVVLLMLDCCRKVYLLNASTKNGQWESWAYRHESFELEGKTVGVIGAGTIGREVIKRLSSFNANLIYYNRTPLKTSEETDLNTSYRSLEDLLKLSDFVTIHVPSTADTKDFIGQEELSLMKESAFLINTARGSVIDEEALIWALENKEIAGAALDVFTENPPDKRSPLLKMSNVIDG